MLDYAIEIHESIPSSNNVVKRAIEEDVPEGLVVCTYQQTAGYGRLGRSWVSPFGGMYCSLLLRPRVLLQDLPALSLVVALALKRALVTFLPEGKSDLLGIKWPNDLVVLNDPSTGFLEAGRFRKVSGISLERHAGGTCVGVGVNMIRPFERQVVGGKNTPVFLVELMGEGLDEFEAEPAVGEEGLSAGQRRLIMSVCSAFLHSFRPLYEQWCSEGLGSLAQEYGANLCLLGQHIQMVNQSDQRIIAGVATGVDAQGRLLLATDDGVTTAVASGEVTLL